MPAAQLSGFDFFIFFYIFFYIFFFLGADGSISRVVSYTASFTDFAFAAQLGRCLPATIVARGGRLGGGDGIGGGEVGWCYALFNVYKRVTACFLSFVGPRFRFCVLQSCSALICSFPFFLFSFLFLFFLFFPVPLLTGAYIPGWLSRGGAMRVFYFPVSAVRAAFFFSSFFCFLFSFYIRHERWRACIRDRISETYCRVGHT